MPRDRLCRWHW